MTGLTVGAVARRKCWRCKTRPGHATWHVCADGNRQRILCLRCDILLNTLVLRWARDPRATQKLERYARKKYGRR